MMLSPDTRLQLDRGEAERFLAALDPTADEWTFQTFDDSRERKDENEAKWNARGHTRKKDPFAFTLHGTFASCWPRLIQLNERGAGVFVTVNATDLKGRKKGNIKSVRALFSDLDGAPLDRVLAEGEPKPHILTETSPAKYHVVWRATDVPLEEFTPTQKVIAERYDSDPTVNDLPRVMRLPGFIHAKGEPFLSRLVQVNDFEPYKWAALSKIFRNEWKGYEAPKQQGGGSNWRDLNTIACARGGDWFPALFSGAYKSATRGG
jgi:RepB DNA-primase N-terminal domain